MNDHTSWRITLQDSIDSIVTEQYSVSYTAMSNDFEGRRRARKDRKDLKAVNLIILEGRTGCGKTTLMIKISRDWANGEILQGKLLIFIKLGRLETSSDLSLASVIRCVCPSFDAKDITGICAIITECEGMNTVFAFDGLDEYSPKSNDNIITNIIKGEVLPNALVIVTSRLAASQKFRQYASKQIEVLGFLQHNVKEYIQSYFTKSPDKAESLITHLEQHPNIMNMCYLPLHSAMLVFLYEEDQHLPETETEIYAHFTRSILLRSIQKRRGNSGIGFRLTRYSDLTSEDKDLFDNICKLAFEATVSLRQVFKLEDIAIDAGSTGSDDSTLGLIVIDRYFMKYGYDETYTFLHQTFQEYLAAVHIAGLSNSEQMDLINIHSKSKHLLVVWRFLCGMMDFSQPAAITLFDLLLKKASLDSLTNIRFAYESQHALPCTNVLNMCEGILMFSKMHLSPLDCAAIGYVINRADFEPVQLVFKHCDFTKVGLETLCQHINDNPVSLNVQ